MQPRYLVENPHGSTLGFNHDHSESIPYGGRDVMDGGISAPTYSQSHQSLGQALGHMSQVVPGSYQEYSISPSPETANVQVQQASASSSHAAVAYGSVPQNGESSLKRKQNDGGQGVGSSKRRRDSEDFGEIVAESGDMNAQGAKHWSDEEKTKLFHWLMGTGQDEHWQSLRATKNSCLRECAAEVFEGKKTYQALKGCFERNFTLFTQLYAFESYHHHAGSGPVNPLLSEGDRIREYERRLVIARKAGSNVGTINSRTIDHWHRMGWYDLFYRRWHGDPATTRRVVPKAAASLSVDLADEAEGPEDDNGLDYQEPSSGVMTSMSTSHHSHIQSNMNPPPLPLFAQAQSRTPVSTTTAATTTETSPVILNIPVTQNMTHSFLQYLQTQTVQSKAKLEILRRREEREEKESTQRLEIERLKLERQAIELEHNRQSADVKQKADRAIELLSNPNVDASLKQVANDYLKRLFSDS